MTADYFLELFEVMLQDHERGAKVVGGRGRIFASPYDDRTPPEAHGHPAATADGGTCGA